MPISRIKTDGIQDDAITSAKIGDTNVATADIANSSVTSAKIASGAVTSAKLDTNIAITGDLTVDTSTLKVNSSNNRVGIGTASPTVPLEVAGDIKESVSGANAQISAITDGASNYATFTATNGSRSYSMQIRPDQSNAFTVRDETGGANRLLINTSGHVTKPSQPFLQASSGPNIRAVTGTGTANTTVLYGSVNINNGNHYNTSTGLFTCPVAGFYRVTQFMMVDTGGVTEALNVGLLKNGAVWLTSYTSNTSYNMNVSNGIVSCSANDTLGVRVGHGGKHANYDSFTVELIG